MPVPASETPRYQAHGVAGDLIRVRDQRTRLIARH
jgi:hypothetical protein